MTTITIDRATVEQALEALEAYSGSLTHFNEVIDHAPAIAALRAALAQQAEPVEPAAWVCKAGGLRRLTQRQYDAQPDNIKRHYTRIEPVHEPVAWVECNGDLVWNNRAAAIGRNLYTAPKRKPLTEEEIGRLCDEVSWSPRQLVRAVERAHGIGRQSDPQIEDRLARHGIPKP